MRSARATLQLRQLHRLRRAATQRAHEGEVAGEGREQHRHVRAEGEPPLEHALRVPEPSAAQEGAAQPETGIGHAGTRGRPLPPGAALPPRAPWPRRTHPAPARLHARWLRDITDASAGEAEGLVAQVALEESHVSPQELRPPGDSRPGSGWRRPG